MPQPLKDDADHLIQLVCNVTEAFSALLFLVSDKNPGSLRLYACQSLSMNIKKDATINIGHGLIGWVAKNDQPTHADNFDISAVASLRYYDKEEAIKSFAAVPVRIKNRVVGVLAVDSKNGYLFTDKVIKILSDFAESFAHMLERGKERIKLSRNIGDIDSLASVIDRLTVATSIKEITKQLRLHLPKVIKHDYLAFAVLSAQRGRFCMVKNITGKGGDPLGTDLPLHKYRIGMVIGHGTSIYVPEIGDTPIFPGASKSASSFLGVPMICHDMVTGAIGLLSSKPKAFNKSDETTLSILAMSCASAFTSLFLHNKEIQSAWLDPLTGFRNHRYLTSRLDPRKGKGVVAILNLRRFSGINRELGLTAGDELLKELGRRLSNRLNEKMEIYRYWGDRFIIVFHGTDKPGVKTRLAELIARVSAEPFYFESHTIMVQLSAGLCSWPDQARSVTSLIENASASIPKESSDQTVAIYGADKSSLKLSSGI